MTVGLGEYRLKPEFCHLKRDVQAMEMVQALNVDELLQQMREAATMHHSKRRVHKFHYVSYFIIILILCTYRTNPDTYSYRLSWYIRQHHSSP
jgi:hypothetical protein